MEIFQNHYNLVFDLTSLHDAAEQLHPELSGESLRMETFFFQFFLEHVTKKDHETFKLTNLELSLKILFFEFSGFYKSSVFTVTEQLKNMDDIFLKFSETSKIFLEIKAI